MLEARGTVVRRVTVWFAASSFLLVAFSAGFLYWSLKSTLSEQRARIVETIQEKPRLPRRVQGAVKEAQQESVYRQGHVLRAHGRRLILICIVALIAFMIIGRRAALRALKPLDESYERLRRFSSDIAHELRTPLNNLTGEMQLALTRARDPEEHRRVLASCIEECDRMNRIIDILLFLAESERPETVVKKDTLDLAEELPVIAEFYEPSAHEKGVKLTVEAPAGLKVRAERTLFQRALGNLIINALRYTDRGGQVTVTATKADGTVAVIVEDTGVGIQAEHLPRIFDRFYRVDRARSPSRDGGGFGLGLSLVRSIVRLHGGEAMAESHVGQGSRFTLRFPC